MVLGSNQRFKDCFGVVLSGHIGVKSSVKYPYIYIQTGSLKTVGQNDIPSRNPVFCVLSGHVFFENLREPDASSS